LSFVLKVQAFFALKSLQFIKEKLRKQHHNQLIQARLNALDIHSSKESMEKKEQRR
jgi:hypothetical protein